MNRTLINPPYGNFKVLNLEGQLMFRCGPDKAKWYLDRNLALSVSPNTIQLTFTPNGPGHIGDNFFLEDKNNVCVVCASTEELTMHHIIPRCYKKHFPKELKNHSSYDVVVLCNHCHKIYEEHAFVLKQIIADEYNVPISGKKIKNEQLLRVRNAGGTLTRYYSQLPQKRIEELLDILRDYYDKDHITLEDIIACANIDSKSAYGFAYHGKYVVENTPNLEDFVKRWRKHFIDVMVPKYLPQGWDLNRTIYRENVKI